MLDSRQGTYHLASSTGGRASGQGHWREPDGVESNIRDGKTPSQ